MGKKVRVILKDGTEYLGRLFMILTTTASGTYSTKSRKIICLEVGEAKSVIRIDDSNILEVVSFS